jgi:hypothetical protein
MIESDHGKTVSGTMRTDKKQKLERSGTARARISGDVGRMACASKSEHSCSSLTTSRGDAGGGMRATDADKEKLAANDERKTMGSWRRRRR